MDEKGITEADTKKKKRKEKKKHITYLDFNTQGYLRCHTLNNHESSLLF